MEPETETPAPADRAAAHQTAAPDPIAAELAAIAERWEALSHRYGYVGGLLALSKAKDDVPRLRAALEEEGFGG
jgi:hypothetical protein